MATPWGQADRILKGKSKGANLIVLGIFMIIIGGIVESGTVPSISREAGTTLRTLAILVVGFGIGSYLAEVRPSAKSKAKS